jgi:DNA-binding NarL/FixJ family response regulator
MSYSILIVDDSAVIRRFLRSWIDESSELQVCGEAENGKIAVEKVKELRPDVVILDFQMPVMNGLEAARQIKALYPKTALVMFTMHRSDELVRDAYDAGIQEVVSKSDAVTDHLLARLRNICDRVHSRRARVS